MWLREAGEMTVRSWKGMGSREEVEGLDKDNRVVNGTGRKKGAGKRDAAGGKIAAFNTNGIYFMIK